MTAQKVTDAASRAPLRVAFSYLRVSTLQQASDGKVGLDRQADAFLPFCKTHGLTPNPDPLIDRGISAYRGKHRKKGALGAFLIAAQQGEIPAGSVLVVDDITRFSREPSSRSEQLLHQLWDEGLALGIVQENKVVDRSTYDDDLSIQITLASQRKLANAYSKNHSRLIADVWERRRQAAAKGVKYPAARPFWCDWDKEANDFELNDQVVIPRLMVQLSIEGKGMTQIAAQLNGLGYRNSSGNPFTYSWVRRILADRRMLGEMQWKGVEEPMLGYFPPVVSKADWDSCWAAIASRNDRKGKVGRGQHIHNLFQGLTRCPCGGPLTFMSTTDARGIRRAYLRCTHKSNDTCTGPKANWRYDEEALLKAFMAERWAVFFRRPKDNDLRRDYEAKLLELEQVYATQQQQASNAKKRFEEGLISDDFDKALVKMMGEVTKKTTAAAASTWGQIATLQEELRALLAQPDGEDRQKQIKERTKTFMAGVQDLTERRNFNNWLATLGVEVVITEPKLGRMKWGATDTVLYRLPDDSIMSDETLGCLAAFGATEEQLAERLEQIKVEKKRAEARSRKRAPA
jgi:hypothetical protein